MTPQSIIDRYYKVGTKLYNIYMSHVQDVERLSLLIADSHPELEVDRIFLSEAALLHDIGIFMTDAADIECYGRSRYIEHGYLGADLLRENGLDRHALVAERHTGMGLKRVDIIEKNMPLPHRDMIPISMEEKIICYADKFFSKSDLERKFTIEEIRNKNAKYGKEWIEAFDALSDMFEI